MKGSAHHRAQVYKQRAIGAVKWTSGSSLLSTGLYVLQSVVLARLLEPRDFGLMAMATTVISVAVAYVDMGVSAAIVQRQRCTEDELSSLYWLNILAGVIVFGIVLAGAPIVGRLYGEPKVTHIVRLAALTFIIAPIGQQYQLLLLKELFFRPVAVIEVSARGFGTALAIGVAVMGGGVYALLFGQLGTAGLSSLLLVLRGHRIYRPRLHFAWAEVRSYLAFGLYQVGDRGIGSLRDNLDKIIIGSWLGAESLGYYNFATNLALLPVNRINPILTRTAFPLFSRLQDDTAALRAGYLRMIRLLSIAAFPLSLGLFALAPLAVPSLFGQKWLPAVPLVQVFSWAAVMYAVGNPVGSLVLAKGRADLAFWWSVSFTAFQAIAVAVGAYLGGALGVALALLVLEWLSPFPCYYFLIKPLVGPCWRSYVASAVPALACSSLMVCILEAALFVPFYQTGNKFLGLAALVALGGAVYFLSSLVLMRKEIRYVISMILSRERRDLDFQDEDRPHDSAQQLERMTVVGSQNPQLHPGE